LLANFSNSWSLIVVLTPAPVSSTVTIILFLFLLNSILSVSVRNYKVSFHVIKMFYLRKRHHFFDIVDIIFCYFCNISIVSPLFFTVSILFCFMESTSIITDGPVEEIQQSIFFVDRSINFKISLSASSEQ
jgi:hypothetical protein